jgi:hypothetical protein
VFDFAVVFDFARIGVLHDERLFLRATFGWKNAERLPFGNSRPFVVMVGELSGEDSRG